MKNKSSLVRLTKISDDVFNRKHPNGIIEGIEIMGILAFPIEVGQNVVLDNFYTSNVTEIINESTFKTLNSTYKIEYLEI